MEQKQVNNDKSVKQVQNIASSYEEEKTNKKSGFSFIGDLFFYLFLITALLVVYLFSSANSGRPRIVLGHSAMLVLSGSMQREIPKGSLIITKQVDPSNINIGDDITFMVDNHTSVTHRVIDIIEDYEGSGNPGFQTQGINNINPDDEIVYYENVVGKVIYHNAAVGMIVSFVKHYPLYVGLMLTFSIGLALSLKAFINSGKNEPSLV